MRLYLAGPMRGKPDENKSQFNTAAVLLRNAGHEVFNPAELSEMLQIRVALVFDIAWICHHAEAIALLEGWERSLGAMAEVHTGLAIGIGSAPYQEFLFRGAQ